MSPIELVGHLKKRPENPAPARFDRGVDTPTLRLVRWPGASWRAALLGSAAAGALSFAVGDPAAAAPTPCVINGAVATCSGDQSAGIAAGTDFPVPAVTTLNVNNLTTAIAPASGTRGISFSSTTTDVTIGSDTGAFGITTTGDNAHGIYAFSDDTAYGPVGRVTVTSTGSITTTGNRAQGIAAFGYHGAVVTSTGSITTGGAYASGIEISSMRGITLTSAGSITTGGDDASGILANGTTFVTLTLTGDISTAGKRAHGIDAFSSQDVTVTSTGNITTRGDDAVGILAVASPFGSGVATVTSIGNITTTGAGIFAQGGPRAVVTSTGDITTTGDLSRGIFAVSNSDVTVTSTGNITTTGVNAGGIEASGHNSAYVTSTGNITTTGARSNGIFAQSTSGSRMVVTSTGNITTTGAYARGIYAVGASYVMLNSTGKITTTGDNASGIVVAASGGTVTVTSVGDITTAGNAAYGIKAESNARYGALTVTSTGNIRSNATGIQASGYEAASVTSTGSIATTGAGANGIFAQSNGAVTVTSTGDVTATGSDASGMSARSVGGPIAVTINSGTVSGGTGSGTGVSFIGGTDNTLVNRGTVMALSGMAIAASTGNDAVSNFGTVIGNVDLGAGTNVFNNTAGGLFNAGASVSLGAGNTLTNAGTLSPGGAGTIQATALTGNLVQTATGRLVFDFNMAGGSADRVNVSGTANLAGTVQLRLLNPQPGVYQQIIVSAAGGVTNSGLSLQALQGLSPALHAELVYPNANDVAIRSSINFVTSGLTGNQTSLANGLNGAGQGSGLGGPIFNLLLNGPTSLDGYRGMLNQLSGETATGAQQVTFDAMGQFVGVMLDPFNRGTVTPAGSGVSGYASEGEAGAYASAGRQRTAAEREAYAMVTKAPMQQDFAARWNVWAAGFGGSQTTDGNAAVGSNSTTSRIAGGAVGADYLIAPNTIAGFALAGGGTSFTVAGGLGSGRSDLFQAGAYARHTMGAAYVAAALAYGWQDITTNRTVAGLDQLQARFKANAWSGRLEGGYRVVSPWMGVAITPYAAGQFTTFNLPAYTEAAVIGSNAFALRYGARDVTAPRSELGFRTDRSWILVGTLPGTTLTLRSRFAWAHDYSTDRSVGATFQSLPGASFVVSGAAQLPDKALTTLAAELVWRNGFSLAGTFDGEFSGNSSSYAGKAVARYQW
ncbi:autotransporter domain-containing protein [Bradyrhizobium cajani]|uniref:autotransporter domain-containing protein n=1 Tax=Bradyrhizobium cajani TaxID=1928661 RepID=UPI0020B3D60A|nr:autotransporter domain-containing protein [Bradyrhizobium cajani]MCP3370526.1 autotransporter domain-containing protein [Bradyrhizobium cajani]